MSVPAVRVSTPRLRRVAARVALALGAAALAPSAHAQLTVLTGPQVGTHVGNLVTNGSFEFRNSAGLPGPGSTGSAVFWATGTASTPFAVPYGWTSSGGTNTYATWGGNLSTPITHRGSAPLPDGQNAMYFGNGQGATTSLAPQFGANGEVTFAGTPVISPPGGSFPVPCTLSQTVNTHLTPAPSYILSVWVSGEGAYPGSGPPSGGGYTPDGIFGLRVTNTQAGDPMRYFVVPSGAGYFGSSLRLEFSFVPMNPLLPVMIEFTNFGHFNLVPFGGSGTTELVLDDVIVNAVPAPGALALMGCAGLAAGCGRRRRRA